MRILRGLFPYAVLIVVGLALRGATQPPAAPKPMMMDSTMAMMMPMRAVAVLYPASGSEVQGTVTFEKVSGGVRVIADVRGLTHGQHGFHIHEYGDCSSKDAASAGGHFNPMHMSHGAPTDKNRHMGDMGNLTAGADGKAHLEWTDPMMSFMGPESIIGRAVVVHGNADDLKSQPAGNAGPRVACGVIGIAK